MRSGVAHRTETLLSGKLDVHVILYSALHPAQATMLAFRLLWRPRRTDLLRGVTLGAWATAQPLGILAAQDS